MCGKYDRTLTTIEIRRKKKEEQNVYFFCKLLRGKFNRWLWCINRTNSNQNLAILKQILPV